LGANGNAVLRLAFYTAGGVQIGAIHNAPPLPSNYIWAQQSVSVVAPATTAYAMVDYQVLGMTVAGPRWFAVNFYASIVNGGPTVRDVTGSATNLVIWNKNAKAGRTSFVSVGNVLHFGDGVDLNKWVLSKEKWIQGTLYDHDHFIVDSNNNLQLAMGAQTATITNVLVEAITGGMKVSLFFSPTTPIDVLDNIALTLAGLTTVPSLNGTTPYTAVVESSTVIVFTGPFAGVPATAYSPETGTATTGSGVTGATEPVWNTNYGQVTQDGGQQWVNVGSSVQDWGLPAPTTAPTVTQAAAPSIYHAWQANTWYGPLFLIFDSGGNIQQLTTAGVTGAAAPAWSAVVGATTNDGTCVWTCKGPGLWTASHAQVVGDNITATYTYYITTTYFNHAVMMWITETVPVTVTSLFRCTVAGITGSTQPSWSNGLGAVTIDGSVTWTNAGSPPAWPGATQTLSLDTVILDSLGNLEIPQQVGMTGAAAPTWQSAAGSTTIDSSQRWLNNGSYSAANTGAWQWAYSGKSSITGQTSTASPRSLPLVVSAGQLAIVQGLGLADPQEDTIVLWRTQQAGDVLMYDDEFPNPGAGQTWIYTETNSDDDLNELITAPIDGANDPPPAGFVPQCYYLGRIWGFVKNVLQWSQAGLNEAFPALNQFTFPSLGVKCWPTSIGLIVYTNSDVWAVLGQGTSSSPFYVVNFQEGVGLANQDAFCVNGSTAYGMLTSGQVVSMDPGAGELEVGFPIGDLFDELYDTANTYCAWHQGASGDTALYVADGSEGWFRMAAVAAPESGNVWSPRALIEGGVKAIASVETMPGLRRLVLGPVTTGPILMRDRTTRQDNATPYDTLARLGSIVLAQPGTTVGVQFITSEEKAIAGATHCAVAVLLDEIEGDFLDLRNTSNDPPNLPPSLSTVATRFWLSQDAETIPKCRHMQIEMSWPAEDFANELLTYTIYGRLPEKARK
jgi:hypothetical protein